MAVEGIPFFVLNDGVLDAVNGDVGFQRLVLFGRQIGEELVFGFTVLGSVSDGHRIALDCPCRTSTSPIIAKSQFFPLRPRARKRADSMNARVSHIHLWINAIPQKKSPSGLLTFFEGTAQWGRSQQVAVDGRLHPENIAGIVPFLKPPQADSLSTGKPRIFLTLSFSGLERSSA